MTRAYQRPTIAKQPGMTPEMRADLAEVELEVLREDAHAHAYRMHLFLQRRFWDAEEFAPVRRVLLNEIETFARKFTEESVA